MNDHEFNEEEVDPAVAHLFEVKQPSPVVGDAGEHGPVGLPATEPVEKETQPVAEELPPSSEDDDTVASTPEAEVQPFTPAQKPVNFTVTRPIDGPAITDEETVIQFLRENPNTFLEILQHHNTLFSNMDKGELAANNADQTWIENVQMSMAHIDDNDTPRRATEREGSHWAQTMTIGGRYIGPSRPKITLSERPTKSELDSFLLRKSGMGATHEFPMPHTGIWIRLRTPTSIEVANMIQKLQSIVVRLGRDTKGQVFSNKLAIFNNCLTELALQCITHTNMANATPADVEYRLSALDEPMLHHGLVTTMFPSSFNYSHPCVADPSKCTHVETAKLDLFSLTWYDDTAYTKAQLNTLGVRFSRLLTKEELDAYTKDSLLATKPIRWFGDLGVRLRVPTVAERRDAGSRWIDGLVDSTHSIFNEAPGEATRNAYIYRLGNKTNARQYSHWVDAIYQREDANKPEVLVTEDMDVIDSFLSNIISTDKYSADFEKEVLTFIDEVINAMVAITSWNCPVCDSAMATKFHERFPHLIPLDIVSTFFTLAGRIVNR
jgi:hypothetical protein